MLPYDAAGAGPAVVLLHAGVLDRTEWADLLAPLAAAGRRTVAFDLPGFGEAELVPGEQAEWADVASSMEELGIESAVLVGNSFGGAVAMRVAAVTPEPIAVPTLVVAGGRDMVDFRDGSERLARQMPNARLATIEEAGHLAPLETPAAFRDLLLEFLEELG